MKPNKSVVYCNNCERRKILFDTEKSAENFMKFNNDEIKLKSGRNPKRSYYCVFCMGWHITSKEEFIGLTKNEIYFDKYTLEKVEINTENVDRSQKIGGVKNELSDISEQEIYFSKKSEVKKNEKYLKNQDLENKLEQMTYEQKEVFFSENIENIKNEIKLLNNSKEVNKKKIYQLNEDLQNLYVFRKKHIKIEKKNNWKYKS